MGNESHSISRERSINTVNNKRSGLLARCVLVLLLAVSTSPVQAAVDDILQAVRQSEFRFARATSEVPFFPLGWFQYRYYSATEFRDEQDVRPAAEAVEHAINLGAVVPAYVDRRDMFLLGGELGWDSIKVQSGPYSDQRIARITPVAAWLHQFGADHTVAAFVAPIFSKETEQGQPWSVNGFGGLIGMFWQSETLQWLYGGVFESYFGDNRYYPYLGMQWNPTEQWSVALIFPWPTISYSPSKGWLVQLGIAPGGSSWVTHNNGVESTQSFGTWNATFGVAKQLQGSWWLFAGAGMTGFRGLTQDTSGSQVRLEAEPSPVYTLAIQFRP